MQVHAEPGPNNSFKPTLLRSGKGLAEKACQPFASSTHRGLTQVLALMKRSSIAGAIALLACLGAAGLFAAGRRGPSPPMPAPERPSEALLQGFEFLGCSGDWRDEKPTPQAWQTWNKRGPSLLIRHAATCGYNIGAKPVAKLSGTSLILGYEMDNDTGVLAACDCEYWVRFDLSPNLPKLTSVSLNGQKAELKSGLAER